LATDNETKIIDFEYSSLNYRGLDLASYLNESTMNYDYALPNHYRYEDDRFPNFGPEDNNKDVAHVESILTVYLKRQHELQGNNMIFEFYLAKELPKLKEQVKKLML
jgi:thiamine kinase-like enzyme